MNRPILHLREVKGRTMPHQHLAERVKAALDALHFEAEATGNKRLIAASWRVHHRLADVQTAAVAAGLMKPLPGTNAGTPKPPAVD